MDDYVTVTKLTDPVVSSIPAGEAREVAYSKVRCVNRFEFAVLPKHEDILRDLFGAHWENKHNLVVSAENPFRAPEEFANANAAMIARDGVPFGSAAYCIGKFNRDKDFGGVLPTTTAKPAITGLTTVHDGKERGLGFCSEIE